MNDGLQKQDTFRFCIRKICTELYFFTQYSEDPDRRKSNNKNFYIYFCNNLHITACAIMPIKMSRIRIRKFQFEKRLFKDLSFNRRKQSPGVLFLNKKKESHKYVTRSQLMPGSDLQSLKQFIDRF